MKSFLLIAVVAATLASCTTAYKSGQTPDDVYYSPQRVRPAAAQASDDDYVESNGSNNSRRYQQDDYSSSDDNYLRMKVARRNRWAMLDNDMYAYNSYPVLISPLMGFNSFGYNPYSNPYFGSPYSGYNSFGFGGGYSSFNPYNSYYGGSYYSPYGYSPNFGGHVIVTQNSRGPVYNRARTTNLNVYNNNTYNRPRQQRIDRNNTYERFNTNNATRSNEGNSLRNTFNNTPNNNSSTNNSGSRSSGSSGSSGGSAPVRRF